MIPRRKTQDLWTELMAKNYLVAEEAVGLTTVRYGS